MSSECRWDWGYAGGHQDWLRKIPQTYDAISFFFQKGPGGVMEVKIGPNLMARIDLGNGGTSRGAHAFVVSYRGAHVVTVHRRGAIELGDPPRTRAAMDIVSAFLSTYNLDCQIVDGLMPFYGKRVPSEEAVQRLELLYAGQSKDESGLGAVTKPTLYTLASRFSFIMPARKGLCSDFVSSEAEQLLHVGFRLGYREAADMLVLCLRERGEIMMAEAVLENRGRAFGCRGMQKNMQALFDVIWKASDGGEWLVDLETKKLVRPLMAIEVSLIKLRATSLNLPETTTMPDGVTYGVVVGADHVAHDKNSPRLIERVRRKKTITEQGNEGKEGTS